MKQIAIGGMHIESGMFSPLRTTMDDFTVLRGDAMLTRYPFLTESDFFTQQADQYAWLPLLHARALPGGMVRREVYETLKVELLDRLDAVLPLDGFYFDIHGAMAVEDLDDAEADLAAAIRARVGEACRITTGMDLHGNVSARLVSLIDLFTAYRTAPHIDVMETREKTCRMLVECLERGIHPRRAWVRVPIALPGERTSTLVEPCATLYKRLTESDEVPGVMDASMWIGYVWADEPRVHAAVVVTGTHVTAIQREAEKIAQRYWDARNDLGFTVPAGDADWCIDQALACADHPVVIGDSGDNPTAGGAGDVPYFLVRLCNHAVFVASRTTAIYASLPDAAAVQQCFDAGVGQTVRCSLGGKLDPVHGQPFPVTGEVINLTSDDPVARRQAVLRCGAVHVIVTERRKPFHHLSDFRQLGLEPEAHKVIVVKIGYLEPELQALAKRAFLALTPGAVNQDISNLPFRRVQRPLFPLDPDMTWRPEAQVF